MASFHFHHMVNFGYLVMKLYFLLNIYINWLRFFHYVSTYLCGNLFLFDVNFSILSAKQARRNAYSSPYLFVIYASKIPLWYYNHVSKTCFLQSFNLFSMYLIRIQFLFVNHLYLGIERFASYISFYGDNKQWMAFPWMDISNPTSKRSWKYPTISTQLWTYKYVRPSSSFYAKFVPNQPTSDCIDHE